MRYFRIPNFSGIEAHRDDANRGSLRVVEGCFPVVTGGMSSGPVWEEKGTVDPAKLSSSKENVVTLKEDSNGNSVVMLSRNGKVHDIHVMTEPKTVMGELGDDELVYVPSGDLDQRKAYFNSIGNRTLMIGEGSTDPVAIGKGPPSQQGEEPSVAPDYSMYGQEWKVFKRCKHFLVGPNKCIFAAGNCLDPLAVYVSEPAGVSAANRDSPYSNDAISRVNIMMSNATYITGLSLKGTQVIVHTDAGCHLLYSAKGVQATTGFRVEQRPTSVASAAASNAVVNRGYGTSPLWLGQDGHIYKDESAAVGQEDQEKNTDKDQASYKAKSAFEHEMPQDLSDSFAIYDASSGTYITYVKSREYEAWQEAHGQTPETEDDYLCPADEDDSESDPVLTPPPTPVAEPEPIVVQPPEEPEQPDAPEFEVECGEQVDAVQGGTKKSVRTHAIGSKLGVFRIQFDPISVPDRLKVEWDGDVVIDTGWVSRNNINDPMFEDPDFKESFEDYVDYDTGWWKPIEGEDVIRYEGTGGVWAFEKDKATPDKATITVHPFPHAVANPNHQTAWSYLPECVETPVMKECVAAFLGSWGMEGESKLFEEDHNPPLVHLPCNCKSIVEGGEYPNALNTLERARSVTLDLIAAPAGIRVRLYDTNSVLGRDEELVFDETGPFIFANSGLSWHGVGLDSLKTSLLKSGTEYLDSYGINVDRDLDIKKYDMMDWSWRGSVSPSGFPSLKIDCAETEIADSLEDCLNAEIVHQLDTPRRIPTGRGSFDITHYIPITPKLLTCLCNFYGKEEYLEELLWIQSICRKYNFEGYVILTAGGKTGGINGGFWAADFEFLGTPEGVGEGVIIMHTATITGVGTEEPMAQFLETYRHESIHAAQDLEHNMTLGLGVSNEFGEPVADYGVIWNQRGELETDAGYSRRTSGPFAETEEEWQLRRRKEIEGNSSETSEQMTKDAWGLVGEKDTL